MVNVVFMKRNSMNNYVGMSHNITQLFKKNFPLFLEKKFLAVIIYKAVLNSLTIYLKYLKILPTSSFLSTLRFQKTAGKKPIPYLIKLHL